jgi:tetratricopeptide (TPR) repeat protein
LPPVSDKDIKSSALQSSASLFDYSQWRVPEDRDRNKFIAELQRHIVEAKDNDEASRLRMRLAQAYLSEGLAPEAMAHLESIARTNIVFYRSAKISALHGVANFLMVRYPEAARDFSASELNNNKEIAYWRSMTADLLGNPEPYDYLALNDDYISKYPPIFRQKLAVVAADRNVENKEYNTAIKIFDTIKDDELLRPIQDYVNYLLAVISSATGQEEEALAMWDKLADNYKSPFVQARAEFSRILWGMERGKIDREQAIDRLERLRLSWHGDNMELKVLALLGNMYADKNDFVNAMRIWDGGVDSFPNTAAAVEMERRLEDAFVNLFDEGTAGRMPPLDVLTLYYQYNDHVPGGNIGDQLVNLLADKLVSVDLLDEAAALLDRKMRKSEKEQRSEVGARLATVHLLNGNPKKALIILQDSVYGDIPTALVMWRNRLLAQSLSEQEKFDKALQIVQSDLSPDAERIRMGVYWQRKNWDKVIASIEALLKTRPDVNKPLTLDESDAVLKLALAYIFEDNKVQLQYLRDYFAPLMANNPYQPLFDFVTARDMAPTPENFNDIMQSVSKTRSFLDSYRARIHTAGLSNITGGATETVAE